MQNLMLSSILAYALMAHASLLVAGVMTGSVPAVLCVTCSAFLAYTFQAMDVYRPSYAEPTFGYYAVWGGSILFGFASALLSLFSGA